MEAALLTAAPKPSRGSRNPALPGHSPPRETQGGPCPPTALRARSGCLQPDQLTVNQRGPRTPALGSDNLPERLATPREARLLTGPWIHAKGPEDGGGSQTEMRRQLTRRRCAQELPRAWHVEVVRVQGQEPPSLFMRLITSPDPVLGYQPLSSPSSQAAPSKS